MIFLKQFSFYLTIICCLCYSHTTSAQEQTLKSPWIIGVDMSLNLYLDCATCNENITLSSTFANGATLHYRIKKWVGLTGHVGYFRQHNYESIAILDDLTKQNFFFQQEIKLNYGTLSIGPKFMLRIGQGDLGLEARFGSSLMSARMHALSPEGSTYDIKYKAVFSTFSNVKLDYTYWPKPNFGLSIGIEAVADRNNITPFAIEVFSPKVSLVESYPNANQETLAILTPKVNASYRFNLVFGINYRFK